jgi:hypothetical protein
VAARRAEHATVARLVVPGGRTHRCLGLCSRWDERVGLRLTLRGPRCLQWDRRPRSPPTPTPSTLPSYGTRMAAAETPGAPPVDDADEQELEDSAGEALALLQEAEGGRLLGDDGAELQHAGPPHDTLRCLDPSHPKGCRWCVAGPPARSVCSTFCCHRASASLTRLPTRPTERHSGPN